jgi:hypothetical protein
MKNKDEIFKKANSALIDIVRGYSIIYVDSKKFYFKHLTLRDHLSLDERYDQYIKDAQKSGIKTEEEIIALAIKNNYWTINKEDEIKSLDWSIKKLEQAREKMSDPLQKYSIKANIEEKIATLNKIKQDRSKIANYSAENFAQNKKIRELISSTFFKDQEFKETLGESEAYSYISELFEKMSDLSDKEIILNAAYLGSFFELFTLHYRQPHVVFGKSGFDLTIYQKNLLVYANSLLNKFKNVSIPDGILDDPVKILNYVEKDHSADSKTTYGIEDLREKSAARGGSLKAEDFLT